LKSEGTAIKTMAIHIRLIASDIEKIPSEGLFIGHLGLYNYPEI